MGKAPAKKLTAKRSSGKRSGDLTTKTLLRVSGSTGNYCGCVRPGAKSPGAAAIKKLMLAAIGQPASTADSTPIANLINAGNPIWEAAIQCMHYGQFNTDELTPMPSYFNTNGATVAGFVSCIQCCYGNTCAS